MDRSSPKHCQFLYVESTLEIRKTDVSFDSHVRMRTLNGETVYQAFLNWEYCLWGIFTCLFVLYCFWRMGASGVWFAPYFVSGFEVEVSALYDECMVDQLQ